MTKDNSTQQTSTLDTIGAELMGPVTHMWLLALDQYIGQLDGPKTQFFYCARAGVRIRHLYETYLKGLSRELPENHDMFWVSRMAICKGTFTRAPNRAAAVLIREFQHQPLSALVKGLLRNIDTGTANMPSDKEEAGSFPSWIKSNKPAAKHLRNYLKECSNAFETGLKQRLRGKETVVLIDSGWQGTTQSMLSHAFQGYDWYGLYIGRILTQSSDRTTMDKAIGLLFENDHYNPSAPESAITAHRHLFEAMLEPNGPSIEEIPGSPQDSIAQDQINKNLAAPTGTSGDALYESVCEYLETNAGLGPSEIIARHQLAMPRLAKMLINPDQDEALALAGKERSADFGMDLEVPVLITEPDEDKPEHADADLRIQHALWPQGQIALEYDGGIRTELQNRVAGLTDNKAYFDPGSAGADAALADMSEALPMQATVAIITRTKNRPLLLKRAAESVAKQTYEGYLWVVVNDGGDEEAVREIIESCAVDRRKIRLVSNARSLGMEAASNAGITRVDSDYVLIHDDDDSLHPDFLKKTVEYLESPEGQRYGGVITGTEYISEEIRGDQVIEHGRYPFMDWVRNIQMAELLAQNLFAPIAFVYRRKIYDEVGGYNETLPVLGDWFFNLEFLLRSDLKVIVEKLAYYHHRDRGDSSRSGVYSNSVIGGQSKHEEFAAVARNSFMRKYGPTNAMAASAVGAYFAEDLRARIQNNGTRTSTANNSASWYEVDRLWTLAQMSNQNGLARNLTLRGANVKNVAQSLEDLCSQAFKLRMNIPAHPSFDEAAYLDAHPDVKVAVENRSIRSGYMHYLMHGRKEGRVRPLKSG